MVRVFCDTSVLLGGLVDVGPASRPAQAAMKRISEAPGLEGLTAWHCCLEFYSVATRLPPEYRLEPPDALALLEAEISGKLTICDIAEGDRVAFLEHCARQRIVGGRLYDAHIAEVARASRAEIVITENPRHFVSLERHGIRVGTAREALPLLRAKRGVKARRSRTTPRPHRRRR